MCGDQNKTPERGDTLPGLKDRFALAVGLFTLEENNKQSQWLIRLWRSLLALAAGIAS